MWSVTRGLAEFSRWLGLFLAACGTLFGVLWLLAILDPPERGHPGFFALAAVTGWGAGAALWLLGTAARWLSAWWKSRSAA